MSIQTLSEFFNVDDGLVASPESACLQGVFDVLKSLFDQVGLRNNKGKMASMAYRQGHPPPIMVNVGLHSASNGTLNLL